MYKYSLSLPIIALLAACSTGPSSSKPVSVNEVVTDVLADGVTISGRYSPANVTSENARKMASFNCINALVATYGERDVDGQKEFQAVCSEGSVHGAGSGTNFVKTGPNSATYSAIFTLNGKITFSDGNFPL